MKLERAMKRVARWYAREDRRALRLLKETCILTDDFGSDWARVDWVAVAGVLGLLTILVAVML